MKIFSKILLFLFLALIILFAIAMIVFSSFVHFNNKEKKATISILKSKTTDSPKALIVYQPALMSNITKDMSYNIAKGLNSKGYEVTLMYPGKKVSTDISKYEVIVLGSPIYIGQTSSVLTNYIKNINNLQNKKVILFVTGANDDSLPLESLGKLIKDTKTVNKVQFKKGDEPKAYNLGCEIGEK
ncbi:flavodoxin family protein [Clostridium hydrogenum]|uniref:flavodoxin family protein n=1 Tax=Clostridium hydrogenum TaxID=2855764 RepID=UPI001F343F99|nr:flavodoxin domain-containing protein [Clostridium hydrogenum]